jgi:hypothetical protein
MPEKIIDYVAGIMRAGFRLRAGPYFGTTKIKDPENAMIITDKRILFIFVPLKGAGQIIGETDISMWQFLLAKKDIEQVLKKMISENSLDKILSSYEKNYALNRDEIERVKISPFFSKIKFFMKDGNKYSYSLRDKNDLGKLKVMFRQ